MTAIGTAARRAVVSWLRSGADAYDIEMLEFDRNALAEQRDEARAERDNAHAAKRAAMSTLGDVAEVLGLRGAPEKWNTREIMTALHVVRRHAGRADRAEDLIAEVGAWVASVTGEHPTPKVRLVDAVRRAAATQADVGAPDDPTRNAMVELARENAATRDILAPDVSTTGTPLDEVAAAALATARATAVAAELRWWANRVAGPTLSLREELAARAMNLDPSGMTPEGDDPPTPTIFRADDEPRVPRRAAAGLAANLATAARRTAQQRDAKAGHPDEVLVALRVADEVGPAQPGLGGVLKGRGDALLILARAVRAYGEEADDAPDAEVEQVAREAAHQAVVDGGVERELAPAVVDALARAGFVPGVYPPGMAIDGDMLQTLIADALPRWATDEFAGELADSVLDAAVRAGFTILHGTNLTARQVACGAAVPWIDNSACTLPGDHVEVPF